MSKRILIIPFFIFFFGINHLSLQAKRNLVKEAQKSMDIMAYKQAVDYLSQAISADPHKKDIRVKQAFAYFRLKKHDESIRLLKEELDLFPDNYNAIILLGYVYFSQGKLEEAATTSQDINTALEKTVQKEALKRYRKQSLRLKRVPLWTIREKIHIKSPNLGLPYFILGFYNKKIRNFDEAIENFRLAIQKDYNPVECYIQLIDVEFAKKDWEEGLTRSIETLEAIGPQSEFYFLMGYAYCQLGEIEKAIYCFKNAIELKPYLVEALKNLAKIYYSHSEFEQATVLLKKILKIVSYDYEAKFLLEDTLKEKYVRIEEPVPELTKAFVDRIDLEYRYIFETNINYVVKVVNEYALSLVRSGKLNEAINWIRSFLELNVRSPDLNYNLAKLYDIHNLLGKALKYAWRAKELKEDFRDAYDLIGNIFFKMQNFETSLQYYEDALKIGPEDALGYYNLGLVYYAMENFEKAKENWKNAIQKEERRKKPGKEEKSSKDKLDVSLIVETRPISFEAHKSLGSLYILQNLKEKALEEFKKAIELEPEYPDSYFEIGTIYYEMKDIEKATFYFDKYLYLGGKEEKVNEILKNKNLRTIKSKKQDIRI